MAGANIVITDISITPNPVRARGKLEINAKIQQIQYVIGEDDFHLSDSDGMRIEAQGRAGWILTDGDALIVDTDGKAIEIYESDL